MLENEMTTETIYYKVRDAKTKDPLRELAIADVQWLKTVMLGYQVLAAYETDFGRWFNMDNDYLPLQKENGMKKNTGYSFAEGIINKLNQGKGKNDLSPRQCQGIEKLTEQVSEIYDVPKIQFKDKIYKKTPATETSFAEIFKTLKRRQ